MDPHLYHAQEVVLRRAAQSGDEILVSQLLQQGAAVDAAQEDGCTPLWLAADKGHYHVVKILCEADADPNAAKFSGNVTPLYIAAQNGHTEVVRLLVAAGAERDIPKSTGATPLFIAAQQNFREIVAILLHSGSNPETRNHMGITPLMIAAYQGNADVVEMLLRYGADPYAVGGGRNAFEWASANNRYDMIQHVMDSYQQGYVPGSPRRTNTVDYETAMDHVVTPKRQQQASPYGKQFVELKATPNAFGYVNAEQLANSHPSPVRNVRIVTAASPSPLKQQNRSLFNYVHTPSRSRSGTPRTARKLTPTITTPRLRLSIGDDTSPRRSTGGSGGCITPMMLQVERSRSQHFRRQCAEDARRQDRRMRASESKDSVSLNNNIKSIDREWQAYRSRMLSQQQALVDSKFDLNESWMYSWGACQEYEDKANELRSEEMKARQIEKAAPVLAEVPPGIVPPVLNTKAREQLESFMKAGSTSKS